MIDLLKEERTGIINEAVCGKGKNWGKKKLKYVAQNKSVTWRGNASSWMRNARAQ